MSDDWSATLEQVVGVRRAEEARRFAARVPAGYREQVPPELAAVDLEQTALLDETAPDGLGGAHRLVVRPAPDGSDKDLRLRRYGRGSVELSTWLPILESFGLVVVQAVPMVVEGSRGAAVHIDDFGLRLSVGSVAAPADADRLVEALDAVSAGQADVDSLNRMTVAAGLAWGEVALLRAYRRYRVQAGWPGDDASLEEPLVDFPDVARGLVAYFAARFDPAASEDRSARAAAARQELVHHLAAVTHLDQDRTLRAYLALVDATSRTTWYLPGPGGARRPTVAYKLASSAVPDLPRPRPMVETWVHGPEVEGIHLRFGAIARGGIRWSERPDDFRTEILGLAQAQVKKNAGIVPTGAKGGFVCRGRPSPVPEEVRSAYATFVAALLDLTDNLVDGRVVTPPGVVAADGEDTYLVVAPDKGTADLSDLANQLGAERGFWLGDAFASGGSHGYDHKAMGITARGAWVAVRRHFHQLGVDVAREPIRVAGVGDMSGDVFGNGMLQSPSIRLVAAFDHRHVFVDPEPDPETSFAERRRLARLPRSSWDDYDRSFISPGGGVWPRDVKRVPLAPAVRRALGISAESLTPPQLVSAVLAAPVDLLWFGGVGTFVRAPDESDADCEDPANDEVRVTADQLRARVVAEGGNLAVTQRARIRYSRRGGRINADFIDNAAGVATSDREVNLKILLGLAIERGRLPAAGRDELLARAEEHVVVEVLRQVDHAVVALNRAVPVSQQELGAHQALVEALEAGGLLDRAVESLPDDEEWARRRRAGAGMIRPELAVVLAYAKSELIAAVEGAGVASAPALRAAVEPYFPPVVRRGVGDLVAAHPLLPRLVATGLAGEIVDRMGIAWAHETAAELGLPLADVACAFWAARQVLGTAGLWEEAERAGALVPAEGDDALHAVLAQAAGHLARRYLLAGDTDPGATVRRDGPLVAPLVAAGATALAPWGAPPEARREEGNRLVALGVDEGLAGRAMARLRLASAADACRVARAVDRPVGEVVVAIEAASQASGADRVLAALQERQSSSRWETWLARSVVDDLAGWGAEVAHRALDRTRQEAAPAPFPRPDDGTGAVGTVRRWVDARGDHLARARRLLDQLDGGADTVTVAALTVRALRAMLEAAG